MPTISIRINDDEAATLDRLVIACRSYYAASELPIVRQLGENVTRSSALRDLLLAWRHDCVEQFDPKLTAPPAQEQVENPYVKHGKTKPMTIARNDS